MAAEPETMRESRRPVFVCSNKIGTSMQLPVAVATADPLRDIHPVVWRLARGHTGANYLSPALRPLYMDILT